MPAIECGSPWNHWLMDGHSMDMLESSGICASRLLFPLPYSKRSQQIQLTDKEMPKRVKCAFVCCIHPTLLPQLHGWTTYVETIPSHLNESNEHNDGISWAPGPDWAIQKRSTLPTTAGRIRFATADGQTFSRLWKARGNGSRDRTQVRYCSSTVEGKMQWTHDKQNSSTKAQK